MKDRSRALDRWFNARFIVEGFPKMDVLGAFHGCEVDVCLCEEKGDNGS